MDSDTESTLISLITRLISREDSMDSDFELPWVSVIHSKVLSYIIQIISLLRSMDLDPQLKPESSELMSLVTQAISIFNSMDLDSQPKPLSELISLLSPIISPVNSDQMNDQFILLVNHTLFLEPEPELLSLIHQIFSLVISMNSKWEKLISLSPQIQIRWEQGKFHMYRDVSRRLFNKWNCLPSNWEQFRLAGEDATHFLCRGCFGQKHEEHNKVPVEMQHALHRKQPLQLVLVNEFGSRKECYCCDEYLRGILLFCSACGFAMNLGCAGKAPVLSIDHPNWHEHTLALFPRQTSLTCNLCALAQPSSPLYMCPSCDFVVHLRCTSLPRVIRISRHPHRISFTHSLDQGDWSCSVCRTKIDKHYGCYSCIKDGCSYVAHSRCATQRNVWDGRELEGELEETEEEVAEPFVRIRDGIIQHFSHQQHHLTLDTNTCRDYDDSKQCQACILPIYFGNFYSCMQCDFILHEECANLSRKIHHPIHPHLLTLEGEYNGVIDFHENVCRACSLVCKGGFFYTCCEEGCRFLLHVQCATISEPLVHVSHIHPLFLTSKPDELRICYFCKYYTETFNCLECDFALCFKCAVVPQKVRYKHDKHMLTLSCGKETSSVTYWCEGCERKIDKTKRFYMCDEYCCVTLHTECVIGYDLYMKPDSSWLYFKRKIDVLPNNHHMSRPICNYCKAHCSYKIAFRCSGLIYCTTYCIYRGEQI